MIIVCMVILYFILLRRADKFHSASFLRINLPETILFCLANQIIVLYVKKTTTLLCTEYVCLTCYVRLLNNIKVLKTIIREKCPVRLMTNLLVTFSPLSNLDVYRFIRINAF